MRGVPRPVGEDETVSAALLTEIGSWRRRGVGAPVRRGWPRELPPAAGSLWDLRTSRADREEGHRRWRGGNRGGARRRWLTGRFLEAAMGQTRGACAPLYRRGGAKWAIGWALAQGRAASCARARSLQSRGGGSGTRCRLHNTLSSHGCLGDVAASDGGS
jgi:hypothetical protein